MNNQLTNNQPTDLRKRLDFYWRRMDAMKKQKPTDPTRYCPGCLSSYVHDPVYSDRSICCGELPLTNEEAQAFLNEKIEVLAAEVRQLTKNDSTSAKEARLLGELGYGTVTTSKVVLPEGEPKLGSYSSATKTIGEAFAEQVKAAEGTEISIGSIWKSKRSPSSYEVVAIQDDGQIKLKEVGVAYTRIVTPDTLKKHYEKQEASNAQ